MRVIERRYIPGNRLVECDVCGLTYRFKEVRKGIDEQKGLVVCPDCFDGRHPNNVPVRNRPEGKLLKVV